MTPRLSPDELASFRRSSPAERRKLASDILGAFQELHLAAIKVRHQYTDLHGLVAYVGVKQEIEDAIVFWRREMQRAAWDSKNKKSTTGAGRSPAVMAHGCAAFASLAGSLSDALTRSGNGWEVAT